MQFLNIFLQRSRYFFLFVVVLGITNSMLYSGLLFIINGFISGRELPYFPEYDWLIFIGLLLLSFICSKVFQSFMVKMTNNILYEFEVALLQKVRQSGYEAFERIGVPRIYTAIGDTRALSNIPAAFVNALNSAILVICCMAYLFWVSPLGGLFVTGLMALLLVFYLIRNKGLKQRVEKIRDLQNDYYRYLGDFLNGFRELKLGARRSNNLYNNYMKKNREINKDIATSTAVSYLNNELTGSYSWYVVLGVVIFLFPRVFDISIAETATFIVTILYLMAPISALIGLLPGYTNLSVALGRLQQLDRDISGLSGKPESLEEGAVPEGFFKSLSVQHMVYEYYDQESKREFRLGPVNFHIKSGETIFITGGNGSGKSTFVNLLTGLYKPLQGSIYFNDLQITEENYTAYRSRMCAIFTNNHLFTENYDGFDLSMLNNELQNYISMLQLDNLFGGHDGSLQLTTKLSKGQQKRLAMIYALLEKKEICVFDEWAAEQDPMFRAYFYKVLLPELKKMGKTIIAVTHDDDYYQYADRVVKFNFGNIVNDYQPDPQKTAISSL